MDAGMFGWFAHWISDLPLNKSLSPCTIWNHASGTLEMTTLHDSGFLGKSQNCKYWIHESVLKSGGSNPA